MENLTKLSLIFEKLARYEDDWNDSLFDAINRKIEPTIEYRCHLLVDDIVNKTQELAEKRHVKLTTIDFDDLKLKLDNWISGTKFIRTDNE